MSCCTGVLPGVDDVIGGSFVTGVTTDATTLSEAFAAQVAERDDAPAILNADLNVAYTWREYGTTARRLAAALADLGLRHREVLGLLLRNRPEFHIADTAALLAGATPFSMYNTSSPEQLVHLMSDADCRMVITEPELLDRLDAAARLVPGIIDQVVVGTSRWAQLLAGPEIDRAAAVSADDLATLMYTSGTTGPPKGVELSHRNVLTMATEMTAATGTHANMRAISYLPMAHIAERVASHYLAIANGYAVVCCPDPAGVITLLPRVEPEVFFSPPRIWQKLQAAIAGPVAAGADVADIRQQLGFGQLRVALTGAAPCPPSIIEFFRSIGISLREIYGLSETTGVISVSPADGMRPGTVGPPLPSAEVKLADDDELLVRGPLVMVGYRNRAQATADAIDADGWLHTGDVAAFKDGHLRIIDRKKELIINAAGKNMSPANIEACLIETDPLIGQACVIGDGRPYNVALIVPDLTLAGAYPTGESLQAAIQACVDHANARLSRVEQIKYFAVLSDEWLPDSEELTPTMKLKRRPIAHKYADQIEALYTTKEKR
jgi:long-chain acyl-CoA synthetase